MPGPDQFPNCLSSQKPWMTLNDISITSVPNKNNSSSIFQVNQQIFLNFVPVISIAFLLDPKLRLIHQIIHKQQLDALSGNQLIKLVLRGRVSTKLHLSLNWSIGMFHLRFQLKVNFGMTSLLRNNLPPITFKCGVFIITLIFDSPAALNV